MDVTADADENRERADVEGTRASMQVPNPAGSEAIRWGAIVVIVLAILYFLARYVIPLF